MPYRGSDEKMMRMWFGLEIDVVDFPPLVIHLYERGERLSLSNLFSLYICS